MISIENINDDMVRIMLSRQAYVNVTALADMSGQDEPQVHRDVASAVRASIGERWPASEAEINDVFICEVIARRPQSNEILIKLGVLSFWDGVIQRASDK